MRERERERWEMSVMKCEICLWRRRGVCEGVGNQEGCDQREREMISPMFAWACRLLFFYQRLRLCPDSFESFVEDHLAKNV